MIVVFEGLQCCGKTTQIKRFVKNLKLSLDNEVKISSWNSDELINPVINTMKSELIGSNFSLALAHALDFNLRIEKMEEKDNIIYIFDRYIYTAYARDGARGIDRKFISKLYQKAKAPDFIFYLDLPPQISVNRMINGEEKRSKYITGIDTNLGDNDYDSMLKYMQLQEDIYINEIQKEKNYYFINALLSIEEQEKIIWDVFKKSITV